MNLYLIVVLAVLAIPVALSFEKNLAFYKRWPAVLLTLLCVSVPYLVWDVLATKAGHWSFNHRYAGGFFILGLPLGEILFFIGIPSACLLLLETFGHYMKPRKGERIRWFLAGPFLLSVAALVLLFEKAYTRYALLSVILFCLAGFFVFRQTVSKMTFWLYMAVSFVAFILVNSILTGLPVVLYGPEHCTGWRILSIPVEDFFYNFAMLGFYGAVYDLWKAKLGND